MLAPLPPEHQREAQDLIRRDAQRTHLRALLTKPTDREQLEGLLAEHAASDAFWTDLTRVLDETYSADAGYTLCCLMAAWADNARDNVLSYAMLDPKLP